MVDFLYYPDMPRYRDFFTHGRRHHYGAKLLGFTAHCIFLVFLENGVELKGIGLTLTRETYYQPAFLGALDMVCLKQMAQKQTVIVL